MIALRSTPLYVLALAAFVAAAAPAAARTGPAQARLLHCGADTCLVIEGRRADPGAPVRVAGHEVVARGGRAFSVAVPLHTVREWSAPFARSIMVGTGEAGGSTAEWPVLLPIGLLGHTTELAALEVSAR